MKSDRTSYGIGISRHRSLSLLRVQPGTGNSNQHIPQLPRIGGIYLLVGQLKR